MSKKASVSEGKGVVRRKEREDTQNADDDGKAARVAGRGSRAHGGVAPERRSMSMAGFVALALYVVILTAKLVLGRRYIARRASSR